MRRDRCEPVPCHGFSPNRLIATEPLAVHTRFWPGVAPSASNRTTWKKTDDEVVVSLVQQVAVIGNSRAGDRLKKDRVAKRKLAWTGHLEQKSRALRLVAVNEALRDVGARWAGKTTASCRFSPKVADSLTVMAQYGGPRRFIQSLSQLPDEDKRLERLQQLPMFRGAKSPRDFLNTRLGLANQKVAIDRRVLSVLREIAPTKIREHDTPALGRYIAIERALVEQVCPFLGCNGFELDQLLYLGQGRDGDIVAFLRGTPARQSQQKLRCKEN